MIKAIFFDIDGTLFSHTLNKVPDSTRECLAKLRQKGVKTVIATGRHKVDLNKLPVKDIDFDGYLTLNGQVVLDETKTLYAGTPIDEEEMKIVSRIFEAKRIPFMLVSEDNKYINFIDETTQEILDEVHCATPPICEYHGEKIYQAMAFVPKHQKELLDSVLDECAITSWHESGIDLIPLGGGKSKGIQQFLDANHMKIEETMAFGDGDNDVDMLEFVGIGVAMGNGAEKAKAAADYVTDTVDNNGIEKALKHFGVID